ncbi:MAG: oligoendopeptidase F [Chloroflexi bacterium]|nr:MAG: oligoendopeptidase F [Chloroflexota bacterium]
MAVAQQVPPRDEIAHEHTWNAESVFATRDAWYSEFEAVASSVDELGAFAGHLGDSATKLADWFETVSHYGRRVDMLMFYAQMSVAVNADDEQAKEMSTQAQGLDARYTALKAFAEPELLTIGAATLRQWVQDEARLAVYAHYIEDVLRNAAHVRSAEVEEVLGMASEPFGTVAQTATLLANADLKFDDAVSSSGERIPVTQSNWMTSMHSADRATRQSTWEHFCDGYLAFKNTFASNYAASVRQNVMLARVRHHESALASVLYPDNIPTEVFHNLINTFKANLPTWHRYWDVKRRALGLETIHPYDIWAPIATQQPHVTYQQAVEWICLGMAPLGEAYVDVLHRGCMEERWVDIYPNQGKRQGAFSYGTYDTYPFIMMSHDDTLQGLSTLAHELGHSMHSYLTRKSQPYIYSNYSMFVAEVASNFNQALVRDYLFREHKDDANFQIALIEEAMSNFHRYFFIMPTLARFELEVHTRVENGQAITADILNGIMRDLFAEGYGSTLTDDPTRTGTTWAQFGHLYVAYYTFQYATGISAAHALADGILEERPGAVDNYLKFLNAGNSVYPIDALKIAGVDMTTPEAVEKTFAVMADMIDRLEALTQ